MSIQTVTLARPHLLPQSADCDCCAGHLAEALRARAGVADVRLEGAQVVVQADAAIASPADVEQLARTASQQIAARYDHPVFAVEGMDCADCAKTIERAMARLTGVHYAIVNFAAGRLRLEYDREQTSVEAIVGLARSLGYGLLAPQSPAALGTLVCSVDGMCCAVEAGTIEQALRAMAGVRQVSANPALARLSVGYDPQALGAAQIVAQVEQLGFRVLEEGAPVSIHDHDHHDEAGGWAGRAREFLHDRPKDALTLACGALLALAWAGELLGAPAALPATLYVLATLVGGAFVARNGWATLRATRTLDINLLMTIAAIGALIIGEYGEGATVVFLFALGNALEGYTMERARRSIRALMQLAPATARVLRGEREQAVPIGEVRVGETIVVRPGDRVPLDAVVLAGTSALDQAPITGESVPVAKSAGDELFAGSINGDGALEAQVARAAQDSTLARIIHLVEEAQSQKSQAQRFIDVFARYYTPAVVILAVLVAILPPLLLGAAWGVWAYRALVMLVIACPCALVISTPVSIVSAISAAARAGVLFKGGASLEAAGGLRAIAFDKTGTLTHGKPEVTDIIPAADYDEARLLSLAAAVELRSSHPLARAIVAAAEERGLSLLPAADLQTVPGRGALAQVGGQRIAIGNRALFEGTSIPAELDAQAQALAHDGRTVMLLASDGAIIGLLAVADQPRAASRATIAALRHKGIAHIAMLTGDAAPVAARVASAVGVDIVRAELLPAQKLEAISELIAQHGSVAMVGDGVNDAPALARATVGIAMGGAGSDAALETADVTLMSDDLSRLPFAIGLSRAARNVILQNVVFALAVKVVFLVATLLGVATLWMAVFADTGAALIVIANGMRLLRQRPAAEEVQEASKFSASQRAV